MNEQIDEALKSALSFILVVQAVSQSAVKTFASSCRSACCAL